MSGPKVLVVDDTTAHGELMRAIKDGSTVIGRDSSISMTVLDWSAEEGFVTAPAPKLYTTGIADPPWEERGGGKVKRGADRHYPLMSLAEICALPVASLFAPNAHLYLWATNNFLEKSFQVIKAWGFEFVTCITWGKISAANGNIQTGLGQYYRGASEQLLFCRRGMIPYQKDPITGKRAQGKTLVLEPRTEHSVKPDAFRTMIEKVSPGPYVELFARRAVPGWDLWGNQAPDSIELPGSTVTAEQRAAALASIPFTNSERAARGEPGSDSEAGSSNMLAAEPRTALPPLGWRKFTDGLGTFPPGAEITNHAAPEENTDAEEDA